MLVAMNIVEVYKQFPTEDDCLAYLEKVRWQGTPICPYCQSDKTTAVPAEKRHHCNNCNTSFSVTVGTIFHHTHLPLQKWFLAVCLMLNAKKGIASRQLTRDLGVNKNTGWYLAMRIRKAMLESDQRPLLEGLVEMDETYIGGKPRKGDGKEHKRGRGTSKTPVVGLVQRDGDIKCEVVKDHNLTAKRLNAMVKLHVDTTKTTIITDEYSGYHRMSKVVPHEVVNHSEWYVDGFRHTNSVESFWSLLKRGMIGQYHHVSIRHLPVYVDEFCYRQNHRKDDGLWSRTISRGLGVE
jgi:transposase-like protein